MQNKGRKIIYTTVSVDKETGRLIEKIGKRYSLKKGEIVKLVFQYIDKAHINPADAPESVKSELSKINRRQDDIIRFIRHYEEEQLNPMIRTSHSVAVKFDAIVKTLSEKLDAETANSKEGITQVLRKMDEQFGAQTKAINNQAQYQQNLSQTYQRGNKTLVRLIGIYSELSMCGVMDSKRKEVLKAEITNLINEQ